MVRPEPFDARSEELAHLAPAGRRKPTEQRQTGPRIELPRNARQSISWNEKVETGDHGSGPYDAGELMQGRAGIVDIPEEIRKCERVEGRVGKGKLLGPAFAQLDEAGLTRRRDAAPARGKHLRALIESDDSAAVRAHELERNGAGAARDVEHLFVGAGLDPRDEEPPPAPVLTEREETGISVIRLGERREELEGRAVALGERLGHGTIVARVALEDDLGRVRDAASAHAGPGEEVVGIVPTETGGIRVYLCAFGRRDANKRTWLALDDEGHLLADRALVRDAVSLAALCELAEESAGGGDIGELRARLVELRLTENPEGIEDAELAAAQLQEVIEPPPRVASLAYLDAIGAAAARLEQALGQAGVSPFAEAMKSGVAAADELATAVLGNYKSPLT